MALIVASGGGTAFAASNAGSSNSSTLKLSAAKKGGDLRPASGGGYKPGERGAQGDRGGTGERGPAGAGGLTSPDRRFAIVATDAGILLSGPQGSVTFDGEELLSGADLKITAPRTLLTITFSTGVNLSQGVGTTFKAQSGGAAQLAGSTVKLGAGTTCPPPARVGSEINGLAKVTEVGSSKVVSVC